jgi:phosphoribosylformylglycinamidine cyclo-ligase
VRSPRRDNDLRGNVLLKPTRIYAQELRRVLNHYKVKNVVHGIAHITGGGLHENVQRILPSGVDIEFDRYCWAIPPVFNWLKQLGNVDDDEMDRVFNMGIGLVLIVSDFYADSITRMLADMGLESWRIGNVVAGTQKVHWA